MRKLLVFIYIQPLHRIVLCIIGAVLLWGCIGRKGNGQRWWKAVNMTALAVSVLAIFYVTVFSRAAGTREAIRMPFQTFYDAKIQPELYRAMLMNIFLFVPVGLSLPFVIPKDKFPIKCTLVLAFVFSACIEMLQYCYGLGRCEVDDILMNTLGALIGTVSYCLF